MEEKEQLGNYIATLSDLLAEMKTLSQPRSKFALQHFVVGQHDLPGRQYQQVILELQALFFAMGDLYDQYEEAQIDVDEAEYALDNLSEGFERRRKQVEYRRALRRMEELKITIAGRMREAEFLLGLINSMPRYSLEQLEKEEAVYWQLRLSRQHMLARMGDPGNLDAVIQMFTDPGKQKPQIAGIGDVLPMFAPTQVAGQLQERAVAQLMEGQNEVSS